MTRAYVGLGANLGDAPATLEAASDALAHLPGTRLLSRSSLYISAPIDAAGPDFVNAVVALDTTLEAHALLLELQEIERSHGRQRPYRNAPRTLDLDLLLFGDTCIADNALTVPHPRMTQRAFVLLPLAEIAPDLRLPDGRTIASLLPALAGQKLTRIPPGPSP